LLPNKALPVYLLAFLLFDLMYRLIDIYSMSIKVYSLKKKGNYSGT
jgi:hypothetical protein